MSEPLPLTEAQFERLRPLLPNLRGAQRAEDQTALDGTVLISPVG
jgi:hypothetical protein